jgi:hypothetical protein
MMQGRKGQVRICIAIAKGQDKTGKTSQNDIGLQGREVLLR